MIMNMAVILDILWKIKDMIVLLMKGFYRVLLFLIQNLWLLVCFLFNLGEDKDQTEIIKPKISTKSKDSPEFTDDSSESEQRLIDKMEANKAHKRNPNTLSKNEKRGNVPYLSPTKEMELRKRNNSKNHCADIISTTPQSSERSDEFRKQNSSTDLLSKTILPTPPTNQESKNHCQVCGSKSATIHCEGPRCYTFFCNNCDDLYHQHPRRKEHKRGDISTYVPKEKPIQSTSKDDQFVSANAVKTQSDKNIQDDICKLNKAKSSDGTTWACKHCTFVNEISNFICQVCCKTNINLQTKNAQNTLPKTGQNTPTTEAHIQTPNKSPSKLTKRSEEDKDSKCKLYSDYWDYETRKNSKSTSSASSSHEPPKSKESNTSGRGTQDRSNRGHNTGIQSRRIMMASNDDEKIINAQEELDTEGVASGVTKVCEPLPSPGWVCRFCTLENVNNEYVCEACDKSKLPNMDELNTPIKASPPIESATNQSDVHFDNSDVASGSAEEAETHIIALEFMQENHIEKYEVANLAYKLMKQNFKLHDAIEAAKNSNNLDEALSYLEQDCLICNQKYHSREFIEMVHCTHRFCTNCTRRHFSREIRKNDITSFVCPICKAPNMNRLETSNDVFIEYFANLANMLRPIIDPEDLDKYQSILRDWFLRKHPDYVQCPQCSFECIMERKFKRMICLECKADTCLECKQNWTSEHQNKSCEDFAAKQKYYKKKVNKNNKEKEQPKGKNMFQKILSGITGQNNESQSNSVAHRQTSTQQRNDNISYAAAASSQVGCNRNQQQNETLIDSNAYQYANTQCPSLPNKPEQQSASQYNIQSPGNNSGSRPDPNSGAVSKNTNNANNGMNNRPRDVNTRNTSNNEQSRTQRDDYSTPSADWKCGHCTADNQRGVRICVVCAKTIEDYSNYKRRPADSKLLTAANDNNPRNISSSNIDSHLDDAHRRHGSSKTDADFTETINQSYYGSPPALPSTSPPDDSMEWENTPSSGNNVPRKIAEYNQRSNGQYDNVNPPFNGQNYQSNNMVGNAQEDLNNRTPTTSTRPIVSSQLYEGRSNHFDKQWALIKDARRYGYSTEELSIATSRCRIEDPITWLLTHWSREVTYVRLSTIRKLYNIADTKLINIPPITDAEAKAALIYQKGDCSKAIAECVTNSLKKFGELQQREELSSPPAILFPEGNRTEIVEPLETNRIISHQELRSGNNTSIQTSTEQGYYHHQEIRNRNAAFTNLPAVHNNTSLVDTMLPYFTRVNTAVDRSLEIITQTIKVPTDQSTVDSINQTQHSPGNPGIATARTSDGVYQAKPARGYW